MKPTTIIPEVQVSVDTRAKKVMNIIENHHLRGDDITRIVNLYGKYQRHKLKIDIANFIKDSDMSGQDLVDEIIRKFR